MTVRFLTSWNGYSAGDRATLAAATESTLIAGGIAWLDYSQAGLIESLYLSRNPGSSLVRGFLGNCKSVANGAEHTTAIQFALESRARAIRFHVLNPIASAITGCSMKFTFGGAASAAGSSGARAPADGAWKSALVGAASTFQLGEGVDENDVSVTSTDIYDLSTVARTDTGMLPLGWVRFRVPAANANRPAWEYSGLTRWEDEAQCDGRIFRCLTQAVDGVTTLGNFNGSSVSNYECVPIIIETFTDVPTLNIAVFGNSIFEKAGSTGRLGWQDVVKHRISSMAKPVEFATFAIGGVASAVWLKRMQTIFASPMRFDAAMFPAFDTNDVGAPITNASIEAMSRRVRQAVDLCEQYGVLPMVCTGLPANPTGAFAKDYGASDILRRIVNDNWRRNRRVILVDHAAAVEGVMDTDGQVPYADGLSSDALHPNTAAHALLADVTETHARVLAGLNLV